MAGLVLMTIRLQVAESRERGVLQPVTNDVDILISD